MRGPRPDDQMFVFKELTGANGEPPKTFTVADVDIKPLGFEELSRARLHEKVTIPLEMHNATIVDTDIEGVDKSRRAYVRTVLESRFTSKAIGLVKGGWLPSALAAHRHRTIILVDRNVVTEIVSRFEGGMKKGREPDFLDVFGDQPVRINPLLYALEGNARATPDPELVAAQLDEVARKLRMALPKADLQIGPQSLMGVLGMIEDSRAGMARREAFLLRLAPRLKSPVARKLVDQRWNEVLDAADACGVPRTSMIVLAALSAIVAPNGANPARAVLKFKDGYGAADAYNALADLRSLEVLIQLFALFPDEIIQLCTADKNLALFWTGLQASNFTRKSDGASYDLDPVEGLLPAAARDRWREAMAAPS